MPIADPGRWVSVAVITAVAAAAIGGCDKNGPDPQPALTGVTITGPAELAPGESGNYSAIAKYSDGSTRDVTSLASWPTSFGNVTMSGPGVAVANSIGDAQIRVVYREPWESIPKEAHGVKDVLVIPRGTFKISGRVTGPGGLSSQTRVTVISGNLAGTSVPAAGADYRLYGAVGPIELEVTAPNHVSQRREINVTGHTVQDFALVPIGNFDEVSGPWTLTLVDPSPSCPPGFPSAARGRTYALNITQQFGKLSVDVSRPGLTVVQTIPGLIGGSVNGSQVTLWFLFFRNDLTNELLSVSILDRLSATETFSWEATMAGTYSGSEIAVGPASGTMIYTNAPNSPPAWFCTAVNHTFTVRR